MVLLAMALQRIRDAPSLTQLARIREEQLAMPFLQTVELRRVEARPFLKWAGGKSSLLGQFDQLFPRFVDRYIEPFVGGGAVFFYLKHRFPARCAPFCAIAIKS